MERGGTRWLKARVSWLNRGTNKRSHYTWCINKSLQPIIRFDLRPQPVRLLLQTGASGRVLRPYLRAAEYIIPKISVRTIQEKESTTPVGVLVNAPRTHVNVFARVSSPIALNLRINEAGGCLIEMQHNTVTVKIGTL